MKKFLVLLLCFSSFQIAFAQYTEVINSRRPGFSESPFGVGTRVLQLESGLFYKKRELQHAYETNGYGAELFVRYGRFLEKLEINLDIAFDDQETITNNLLLFNSNYKSSGISKLTFGAKYLIYSPTYTDKSKEIRSWKKRMAYDKKRLIPAIGISAGVNTDFLGENYKRDGISFKGALLLQNDFTEKLIVISNIYGDYLGKTYSEYGYILTITYAFRPNWTFFAENQGVFKKDDKEFQIGGGFAYLLSKNLQLDTSARTNFLGDANSLFVGLGASWRLDRHRDRLIIKKGKKPSKGKKPGNMLSRTFGKKKKKTSRKKRKRKRKKK